MFSAEIPRFRYIQLDAICGDSGEKISLELSDFGRKDGTPTQKQTKTRAHVPATFLFEKCDLPGKATA